MRKLILLLLSITLFASCSSNLEDVPFGGSLYCLEYFVFLNSSDNCDEEPIRIQISRDEYDRLDTIRIDGEGFCIAVTINPLDGSDSSQGWINKDRVKALESIPIIC